MATSSVGDHLDPMDISIPQDDFQGDPHVAFSVMTNVDLLHIIFSYVPFTRKVTYESVCKIWNEVLTSSYNKQFALGNDPTKLDMVDRCHDQSHIVTKYDIVPKIKLTNPNVLVKILKKCPNLRAISITDNGESTYKEAIAVPPGNRYEGLPFAHLLDRMLRHRPMDELEMHFARGHNYLHLPMRGRFGHGLLRENIADQQITAITRYVYTAIDRFCSILSKEQSRIECLDLTGLYIDSETPDGWRTFTDSPARHYLKHLKCSYLDDRDLALILTKCPIVEISAVRPMQGTSLHLAPGTLQKVALKSIADHGLETLSTSSCVDNLRQIFLCNVSPVSVELMVHHFRFLTHVNLSFGTPITSSNVLNRLHSLNDLQHLYLKFKPGMLLPGVADPAFNSILSNCLNLEVLQLVNCPLKDSLRLLARCDQLKVFDFRVSPPHVISDVALTALASLDKLKTCFISCLNTFSETSLIEMLIKSQTIRSLKLHGCRELIPDSNIFFAALKRAKSLAPNPLTIEIQIEEEMAIVIAKFPNIPYNLQFTIRTGNDFYTTKNSHPSFIPTGESVEGDFDADVANQFADQL